MKEKSDNYRYRDSWESDNSRKENKGKKQRYYNKNEAKKIKSDNCSIYLLRFDEHCSSLNRTGEGKIWKHWILKLSLF